jgi:addiction module HigA family antidote
MKKTWLPHRETLAQFMSAVRVAPAGCWLWTARCSPAGYGLFHDQYAHRISYSWFVDEIPPGLQIDHLCCQRSCVNPVHLEAVTASENQRRRWRLLDAEQATDVTRMQQPPIHPGEIFDLEFLQELGVSQRRAAKALGMSTVRLNQIVKKKRPVTPESAVLIGAVTGTDPRMWLRMQADRDLWFVMQKTDTSTITPLRRAG